MRGTLEPGADHAAQSSREIEALVIESRFGRGDVALRQVESMLPAFEQRDDSTMLLHALYARALIVRRLGSPAEDALDACDVLEDAARSRGFALWAAVACALRAQTRVDEGDVVAATADLARADIDLSPVDLASPVAFRLLDALAVVYARLRLHDRLDDVRERIESTVDARSPLERAIHWAGWCSELAVRAMEPVAMGEGEPATPSLRSAVEIGARIDSLPPAAVPPPLRRGVSAVRALAAAYRGRPSEALRILGQDAFGEARQLPPVERQIATLAAMRAHAHVGSIASARSLDDAAGQTKSTLVHLVLSVCRARERLWLETHAGGQVVPVLNRLVELLVRLGWHGMDLVADIARQSMEHHALREESRTDALTGVGNRRALDEELRQLVRFSQLPLSLVLVDVDDFKGVNDRFTHVVGDEVLRHVASSLSEQLRGGDRLLRFGGDEFVALLPATGDQEAHRVAARMSRAIENVEWGTLAPGLHVTVTTGSAALWSLTERRPDADAERLFQRADEALLSAKRRRTASAGLRPASIKVGASRSGSGRAPGGRVPADPTPSSELDVRQLTARTEPGTETHLAQSRTTDPAPRRPRVPSPSVPNTPLSMPMPVASLFNEPTSFVQPVPVSHQTAGEPSALSSSALSPYAPASPAGPTPVPSPSAPPPTLPNGYTPNTYAATGSLPPQAGPASHDTRQPKAWEPGWQPEWATNTPPRDPLTDPLTGPLLEPLLDPLLDPGTGRHRPAPSGRQGRRALGADPHRGSDFTDPDTDALDVIDLTSGLARRRRVVEPGTTSRDEGFGNRTTSGSAATNAEAYAPNGVSPNGLPPIGFPPNGAQPNGAQPNGAQPNGLPPIGLPPIGFGKRTDAPSPPQETKPAFNGLPPIGFPSADNMEPNGSEPHRLPPDDFPSHGLPPNGLPPIGYHYPPAQHQHQASVADPDRHEETPPVIDLTAHGLRRNRERLRSNDSDPPR